MTGPRGGAALLDAGWRAAAYCLHPRVIGWSLAPLLIAVAACFALSWFFWEPAVSGVRAHMESWLVVEALLRWLEGWGGGALRSVLPILILLALALPLVMVLSLLLVAALMTPALTQLVAERRFAGLEKKRGGSLLAGLLGSLGATALALLALFASLPFWLVPGVLLVLPPLIWGWLTYRVFSYDVLADHASREELLDLRRQERWPLLAIGVVTGYLGAAPSLLFAIFGVASIALAPLLLPIAIWLYMLVFAFAALWFAHYLLGALQQLRSPGATQILPPT